MNKAEYRQANRQLETELTEAAEAIFVLGLSLEDPVREIVLPSRPGDWNLFPGHPETEVRWRRHDGLTEGEAVVAILVEWKESVRWGKRVHPHSDKQIEIVSGKLRLILYQETEVQAIDMKEGDTATVPAGTIHDGFCYTDVTLTSSWRPPLAVSNKTKQQ